MIHTCKGCYQTYFVDSELCDECRKLQPEKWPANIRKRRREEKEKKKKGNAAPIAVGACQVLVK